MSQSFIVTIIRGPATYLYEHEGVRKIDDLIQHGRLTHKAFNSLEELNAFSLGFDLGQRDSSAMLASDLVD
jgi:hypothetical protein